MTTPPWRSTTGAWWGSPTSPSTRPHGAVAPHQGDRVAVVEIGVGVTHDGVGADLAPGVDDGSRHPRSATHHRVGEHHAVDDLGSGLHDHSGAQHAASYHATHDRTGADQAVAHVGPVEDPGRAALRLAGQNRPPGDVQHAAVVAQHVAVGPQVEVRLAQVTPVAVMGHRHRTSALHEPGQ